MQLNLVKKLCITSNVLTKKSVEKVSRIGKKPISIPDNVKVTQKGQEIVAKGPIGDSSIVLDQCMAINIDNGEIKVTRKEDSRRARQLHGLSRSLLYNLITGVGIGFEKKLNLVGVGYKARVDGTKIIITAGFSHDVIVPLPDGIEAKVTQNVNITVYGNDKSNVSNFAAKIRRIRAPEPYGGKGIRYVGEIIKMKEGKSGKK